MKVNNFTIDTERKTATHESGLVFLFRRNKCGQYWEGNAVNVKEWQQWRREKSLLNHPVAPEEMARLAKDAGDAFTEAVNFLGIKND